MKLGDSLGNTHPKEHLLRNDRGINQSWGNGCVSRKEINAQNVVQVEATGLSN